ncbi:MAG: HAD-IA family hydrolase [Nitrospirota bacterium]|nr:HAD-IA family hydrolase [Nitrospirota bacterium]MDE3119554.1 HAD-IA family hydrolase [Nitrospirota bacterium]MDE3225810.1 HAD-IA family hydrolase [Nitrospirota bacterium]MDE3243920.1 HAD-IA family hydrolase [Nitrospirota bacterium]
MSSVKVVFFDAAGTLFHVKGSVADVYLSYAEPFGVRATPSLTHAVNEAFLRAFRDAPPPIFAVSDPAELKQCERLWWFDIVHNVFYRVGMFEGFDDYFDRVYDAFAGPHHWALYPDTLATLHSLKSQGFELGIISNFDTRLFTVLKGLGLADLFDTVTISSLARAAKPAPNIFRLALDQHAVDADEAVHVGDSVKDDLEGARAAKVRGLLLDREGSHPGPFTIKGLDEVSERIAGLPGD